MDGGTDAGDGGTNGHRDGGAEEKGRRDGGTERRMRGRTDRRTDEWTGGPTERKDGQDEGYWYTFWRGIGGYWRVLGGYWRTISNEVSEAAP